MDEGSLYICYNAAAEFSAHHSLGRDLPIHCLDLHAEERVLQNGKISGPGTFKLPSTLGRYGLPSLEAEVKEANQRLAMRGAPFNKQKNKFFKITLNQTPMLRHTLPNNDS